MKISHKVIAIILFISLTLIIIGNWLFGISIKEYLIDQEYMQIKNNVDNVLNSLLQKEDKYLSVVNDWAHWDDTYDYINTKSDEYVESNLNAPSLKVLDVNLMIFYNKDNVIIDKVGFDLENQKFTELSTNLIAGINENVKNLKPAQDSIFILNSDNKFYIIAASKTTDSLQENVENGTLVVGRLIDEATIAALEKTTNGKISFLNVADIDTNIFENLQNSSYIYKTNDKKDTITAYILKLNPTNEKAPIIINLVKPMNIFKQGLLHIHLLQALYSLLILILIIFTFISLRIYISIPIFKITKYLNNIDLAGKGLDKLPTAVKNEFSIISRAINNMLSKINLQHDELRKSEERLRLAQSIAHVGNWELDLQSKIIFASDEALNIYGIENSTGILPLNVVQNLVLPEYRPQLDDALKKLIATNSIYEVEFKISRASDMIERYIYSRAKLVLGENGNPVKVLGIIHDITERKEYEKK